MLDDLYAAEWRQWQELCKEFRAVVGDINDPRYNKLVAEIKTWAELAARLPRPLAPLAGKQGD